ncbi:hypothetical protein V1504DRAFT_464865 [Lipomyces starkeyi]
MFHETTGFQCSQCNHAPFNSKTELVTSVVINGESYALAAPESSSKYPCPQCDRETASLSALRRHMAHSCQGMHNLLVLDGRPDPGQIR